MRKYLLLLPLLWLLASPVHAAIVCSDAIEFNDTTPTDPETISYTTPDPCVNCTLFVAVIERDVSDTISSATHAGNAMTATAAESFTDPMHARMFYIASPTAGTNDVVVDYSGTPLADAIIIFTCSGTNTASPVHDATSATGTGTVGTLTVPNLVAGDVIVDIFGEEIATVAPTEGANQTVIHSGADGAELGWGSSYQAAADGGVMSWTLDGLSDQWAMQAVAITEAPAAILSAPPVPSVVFQ